MKKYSKYFISCIFIITFLVSICFIPISVSRLIPVFEEQIEKDLGVKVHIERLILRVGPFIKLKAPIMHLMYEDGKKFAQFDNVKFYISLPELISETPLVNAIKAKKMTVRVASDDKHLVELVTKLNKKNPKSIPNIALREYSFTYFNNSAQDKYVFEGQNFELNKNFKLKTNGSFGINSQKHINYDITLNPNFDITSIKKELDLQKLISQIKDLDFYSDIIADIKLYYDANNAIQASGFINIDNISVLDIAKKNPKSFVYLTLWGNKAGILSNIYTSANKKVYIEGMLNNSSKPVLDLKVKTDEIDINELYQKIKIFADFSHIKNINSVKGTLNANFALKGDLNKIKSSGYMKISNASIDANGLRIDNINSDIDFSNNLINITKAVGYVNKVPIIAKGNIGNKIDIEILMNKVELKYLCPASWGVQNGITSLIANISGSLKNIEHKENLIIEGLKAKNKNLELDVESLKFDTNKNNTAYISNILCKVPTMELIKIPSLKLIINDNNIKIPESNIYMPNSKVAVSGEIVDYNNPNFVFSTALRGYINSKDIISLSNYSTRYPVQFIINGNSLVQNINSQILFEKTDILDEPAILNLIAKLEKNNLKIDDLSLLSFSGALANDFRANLKGGKKITITGNIENVKQPVFKNIRLFIPQLLNLNLGDTLLQTKGDVFINGELKKPEIVGQITIQNLLNQLGQLSLSNCTLDFNKNNIVLNAPLVKLLDSSMGINALISTDFSNKPVVKNINIKSKYLNTDTFLMYKDIPVIKNSPIVILNGKLYSEKVLANIYGSALYLSALTSDFKLEDNLISIKNMSSEIYNGKVTGSIDYNLRDEHYDAKLMARGVSAEPIFNIVSTRKDSISGVMDFDANLKGELISKQSLNGNVKFIVNNGRMSTLGKLEHLLYAQNVIADNMLRTSLSVVTKAITLKDTGLFKYLRGDIDLENGIANIKMLQSQGPLMSLYIKGLYNTLNDYAQLIVLGRLSDEVISGLGAFGDFSFNKLMVMLTGEEVKYNVVPEDFDKIPQLPMKNTKEFRSIINGIIDKPSSVILFNWISYSQKSLKQKETPMTETKLPEFIEALPY